MNIKYVYDYYRAKGLSHEAAAGFAGNFAVESNNFDQRVLDGRKRGDKGTAWYVAQWRGDRLKKFRQYARATRRAPENIDAQLDFAIEELNPRSPYRDPIASKNRNRILRAPSVQAATDQIRTKYERASKSASASKAADRRRFAMGAATGQLRPPFGQSTQLPKGKDAPTPTVAPVRSILPAQDDPPVVAASTNTNLLPQQYSTPVVRHGRRSEVPTSGIVDDMQILVEDTFGPGYRWRSISGQEPEGRGPVGSRYRHPEGFATDGDLIAPDGSVVKDQNMLRELRQAFAARTGGNVGFSGDNSYMGRSRTHFDVMPVRGSPDYLVEGQQIYPGGRQWGNQARSEASDLDMRRQTRLMPDSFYERNMPTDAVPTFRDDPVVPPPAEVMVAEASAQPNILLPQDVPTREILIPETPEQILLPQDGPDIAALLTPPAETTPSFGPRIDQVEIVELPPAEPIVTAQVELDPIDVPGSAYPAPVTPATTQQPVTQIAPASGSPSSPVDVAGPPIPVPPSVPPAPEIPTTTPYVADAMPSMMGATGSGAGIGGILSSIAGAISAGRQAEAAANAQAQAEWQANFRNSLGPSPAELAQNLAVIDVDRPAFTPDEAYAAAAPTEMPDTPDALMPTSDQILADLLLTPEERRRRREEEELYSMLG